MRRPHAVIALILLAALPALAGCGDDGGDGNAKNDGTQGGGGAQSEGSEKATRDYIVESRSDEDNSENADALSSEDVQIDGDSAEVKAKSSLTGNNYEATLRKVDGSWKGSTLFTDVPSEPTGGGGGGDPTLGPGKEFPTDQVEQQIRTKLLKPLGLKGKIKCPPTIKLRRGNNFDCKVTGTGRNVTVKVTQKDDQGNLNFKVTTRP
jgi:hypothetical protein